MIGERAISSAPCGKDAAGDLAVRGRRVRGRTSPNDRVVVRLIYFSYFRIPAAWSAADYAAFHFRSARFGHSLTIDGARLEPLAVTYRP